MWPFRRKKRDLDRERALEERERQLAEKEKKVAELSMVGHAIVVNPSMEARSERNRGRIERLKRALADLEKEGRINTPNYRRLSRELRLRELPFQIAAEEKEED